MPFEFAYPLMLWLLVPLLGHAVWMARRLRLLSPARRASALALRVALIVLLMAALAGLRRTRQSQDLTVFFAVDDSESVGQPQREYARQFVQTAIGQMGQHDQAGMIRFGSTASLHEPPSPQPKFDAARTLVDAARTNIASALQLAMACFAPGAQKRIVLISDGNQNAGEAAAVAQSAAAAGIAIDVVPLHYENRQDVIVEKAVVENRVSMEEPFDLRVVASARQAAGGKLNVIQDGRLVGQFDVDLQPNQKNVLVVPTEVLDSGFHSFEVQLDVEGDQIPENNRAYAFTYATGEPHVLLVDGDAEPSQALPAVLQSEKIDVETVGPAGLPLDIGGLEAYDEVILNNVAAGDLAPGQMQLLAAAVENLGIGLVMIGGENSFGPGGYNDSPIERVLPVNMELKNEKILPQGALVPIIHTVEIPQGQYWSEQIALAALDVLSPRDLMGVLYYSWNGGESWLFPLQPVGEKVYMRGMIKGMQPGDMPSFDRTLQMAYTALNASTAAVKHIVIISDGDPQTPNTTLVRNIQAAGITISTVVINPHSPRDKDVMRELARLGGGNYYDVSSFNKLPQIFTREAATVRKSLIFEEPFTPVEKQYSPILTGMPEAFPQLKGYVGTSAKDLADVPLVTDKGDPLLAHWRHGLGKTVAFTSDAKPRWASQWLTWDDYSKFWSQVVRWSLRAPFNPNYQVQMSVDGAKGTAIVDAVDAQGNFMNFLEIAGDVIAPSMKTQHVEFRQKAPGRYEAQFDVGEAGTYMLGAQAGGGTKTGGQAGTQEDLLTGGTSVSYSPEFQASRSNEPLLYRLADITGGRELSPTMPVFDHNLTSRMQATPLWPMLLALALFVLLADVFARRVLVGPAEVAHGLAVAWRWSTAWARPKQADGERATTELLEVKRRVRRARPEQAAGRERLMAELNKRQGQGGAVEQARAAGAEKKAPTFPQSTREEEPETKLKPEAPTFTGELLRARDKARKRIEKDKPN